MITVDLREHSQHPETEKLAGGNTQIIMLDAADYAFLDRDSRPTGIERCEIGNLIQKLRSGELEQQLRRCAEEYQTVVLLIEGVWDARGGLVASYKPYTKGYYCQRVHSNTYYEYVMSFLIRVSELGIEVMQTPNLRCSLDTINTLYKQRTKPEEQHTLFKHVRPLHIPPKLSANPAVPKLMGLCPRMPERVAIRLIFKYGTIWSILNASTADLLEVEGMGRGLVKNLRESVGYEIADK
jgi:ERCC4-type nuclease